MRKIMLDSGADVSLINYHTVKHMNNIQYDKSDIYGIDDIPVQTIGYIYLKFNINNVLLTHKFLILEDVPFQCIGLLGKDFMYKNRCILDYDTQTFKIRKYPYCTEININTDHIEIKPRVRMLIKLPSQLTGQVVVHNQRLSDGVFLARQLCTVKNNQITCEAMNVKHTPKKIMKVEPEASSLNDYEIVKINSENEMTKYPDKKRQEKLLQEVDTKNLNDENIEYINRIRTKKLVYYTLGREVWNLE